MQNRMLYRKLITVSTLVALMVMIFATGWILGTRSLDGRAQAQSNPPAGAEELFVPFWEAWNLLHENYVDPLDDNALMEGALSGMMKSPGDPHTEYMDPETFARVNEYMGGAYEGIGAVVRQDENTGGLELVSIMEQSPAEKAGLQPGDKIIQVSGEDITALDQNEIIARVRGPAGTVVRLGIQRPGEKDLLQFDVTRERITVSSVVSRVMEGNIGYVRLTQFEANTGQELRDALEAMDANHLKGLILDVRGNPGGYLTTSIEVASVFIEEGPIVVEHGPNRENTYNATGDAIAPDVPLVVLVDQGSASASELISGALQDRGRATIVGMPTFGKGSVQTWRELSNGGGVRITISRWYTPNGRSVSEHGIDPDVVIPYKSDSLNPDADNQVDAAIRLLNGEKVESEPLPTAEPTAPAAE